MNLTVDIGNTRTKFAIFNADQLQEGGALDSDHQEREIRAIIEKHPEIKHVICSTVGDPARTPEIDNPALSVLHLDHNTSIPFINKYRTPETLGNDRICHAAGAASLRPGTNVLVIDAGTCITLDLVNEHNEFLGGSIAPGIRMRFKALHTFTSNLPLVEGDSGVPPLIGGNTCESIESGVLCGVTAELCGLIERYNNLYTPLTIMLTGGDSPFLEEALLRREVLKKNEIFANPNLVHIGLNAILNFNVSL